MSKKNLFPGDIVIVEYTPQNDPSTIKARPALIISSQSFHCDNLDVIILVITSVVRYSKSSEIVIKDNDSFFHQTGLKVTSSIRCGSICSFPKAKIHRRIGTVPQHILKDAVKRLVGFLEYSK